MLYHHGLLAVEAAGASGCRPDADMHAEVPAAPICTHAGTSSRVATAAESLVSDGMTVYNTREENEIGRME